MAIPSWLEPLPDAAQQHAVDSWAIDELHIASETLMERAATGLARLVADRVPEGRIAVLAGTGNNGADGRIAARLLADRGRDVDLIEVTADADIDFGGRLDDCAAVIDALLGTGFHDAPRQAAARAIGAVNTARGEGLVVIACDLPSGVNASTGEVATVAVSADLTVTFHAAKPGLWLSPGKGHVGEVTIVDIGIPTWDLPVDLTCGLITQNVLDEIPRRGADSNKFTSGHVLVVAGSARYTGAPALVSMSAARAGAGYVTVSVPREVVPVLQGKLLEPMVTDHDGAFGVLDRASALVVGPGLGGGADVAALVRRLCDESEVPLVLDADGLNALAGDLAFLDRRGAPTILTPHAGELGRLLGCGSKEVGAHRLARAQDAAERSGAIVVLKGDDTIVAHPDGRTAISPGGVPALATAGTGDVLSGVIGAYAGKGLDPFTAACAGVYAHLRAGALAGAGIGQEGVIASDVISELPHVFIVDRDVGADR